MSRSFSAAMKADLMASETDEALIILLVIDHSTFDEPIRVCSDGQNVTSNGDEYVAYPFDLLLPDDGEKAAPRARLKIDAVNQIITTAIRTASNLEPPDVSIYMIRASDPDTLEMSIENFKLINVRYNATYAEGDLSVEDFTAEPFPEGSFNPAYFPGMF